MLLRVIAVCFASAVLAETMLQGTAALATATLHRQAIAAARSAFAAAAENAQQTIAAAVSAGAAIPATLPSAAPACVVTSSGTCLLSATVGVSLATPQPTACPSSGCAAYAQGNDAIGEGRAVATIVATISNAAGRTLAVRGGSVVFRTVRVAPYAMIAGVLDATLDDAESGPGDAAGIVPGAVSQGTLVDVVYENAVTGAIMPANVWSGLAPSAPTSPNWSP